MWQIDQRPRFSRQYKLLGRERQKRADSAILDLAYSENPSTKGDFKKTYEFLPTSLEEETE